MLKSKMLSKGVGGSNAPTFVGLDIAKKMGVAYLRGDEVYTAVYTGSAHEQLAMLLEACGENLKGTTVFVERLNSFLNANTVRSLLLRTGYITGSLEERGAKIEYYGATQARKAQGVKSKEAANQLFPGLTNDEADATMVLLCGLGKHYSDVTVYSMEVDR